MSRLSNKRRAKLKLQAAVQMVADQRNLNDDSVKLQRGPVRSSVERFTSTRADKYGNVLGNSLHSRAPKPIYDGLTKGTPTRVQAGRVVIPDMGKAPEHGKTGLAKVIR